MLDQRLRRWPSINPVYADLLVLSVDLSFLHGHYCSGAQIQTAVAARSSSQQLPPFGFAEQCWSMSDPDTDG